eukprot:1146601-Pleurochrysis_carterae.AAC.2
MNPRNRLKHRCHTYHRASGRGRTPKATVPSGTEADDVFSPRRPRNLSSDWEEERRGPELLVRTSESARPETSRSQVPIEEGSEAVSARCLYLLVRTWPTPPLSYLLMTYSF